MRAPTTDRLAIPSRSALLFDVLPVIPYTACIFYTGLIHLGKLPEVGFVATDKLLHALVFGGLALVVLRAARSLLPHWSLVKRLTLALVLSSFVGALLEVCQWFTTYRSADVLDWVADTVGAVAFLGAFAIVSSALSARQRPSRAQGS